MNPKLKSILIISAKQAVNAVLTSTFLFARLKDLHWHSWVGVENILYTIASVVLGREISIWIPKILAWTNTNGNGDKK